MQCTRPNKAVITGQHKSGSPKLRILKQWEIDAEPDYILRCGKCTACKMKHAKEWANRLEVESNKYPGSNWFITLTYTDENVPKTTNKKTGERIMTLNQPDLTKWLKRVRKKWAEEFEHKKGIRYLACGEYGPKTARPHYHCILMNLPIEKIKEKTIAKAIGETWTMGHIDVQAANGKAMAYVAGYTLKKANNRDKEIYEKIGIAKEFITMSRMPGIGKEYYEQKKQQIYATDEIWTTRGAKKPPKYFDKMYKNENKNEFETITTKRREKAKESRKRLLEASGEVLMSRLLAKQEQELKEWLLTARKKI